MMMRRQIQGDFSSIYEGILNVLIKTIHTYLHYVLLRARTHVLYCVHVYILWFLILCEFTGLRATYPDSLGQVTIEEYMWALSVVYRYFSFS